MTRTSSAFDANGGGQEAASSAPDQLSRYIQHKGAIDFCKHKQTGEDPKFVKVQAKVDKEQLWKFVADSWGLHRPGVIVRVAGTVPRNGHKRASLLADTELVEEGEEPARRSVAEGVIRATSKASGIIFSTGLDMEVSMLMGNTLGQLRHRYETQLIGVSSWSSVQGRRQLTKDVNAVGAYEYIDQAPNDDLSTISLQPAHQGFIFLAGDRAEDDEEYGDAPDSPIVSERSVTMLKDARMRAFKFALDFEEAIKVHAKTPRVLVVIHGDKLVLSQIIMYLERGEGLVLIASKTGGLAEDIAEYLSARKTGSSVGPEISVGLKDRTESYGDKCRESFETISKYYNIEKTVVLTDAATPETFAEEVLSTALSCAEDVGTRVRFAVEWQDAARLRSELMNLETWDDKREDLLAGALQLALEREAPSIVKECIEFKAPVHRLQLLQLFDKLYDPLNPPLINLFVGSGRLMPSERPRELRDKEIESHLIRKSSLARTQSSKRLSTWSGQFHSSARGIMQPLVAPELELSDDEQQRLKNTDVDKLHVYDFIPTEAFNLLSSVSPALGNQWDGLYPRGDGAHAPEGIVKQMNNLKDGKLKEHGQDRSKKLGPRWLDVFVWAVLLGNEELAMKVLFGTEEPIRTALIGVKLCKAMAVKAPLYAVLLHKNAADYEDWCVHMLDLCETFDEARRILMTKSDQWKHTILDLAIDSDIVTFCAHYHCQTLCDEMNRGNDNLNAVSVVLASRNTGQLSIIAYALCPLLLMLPDSWIDPMIKWNVPYDVAYEAKKLAMNEPSEVNTRKMMLFSNWCLGKDGEWKTSEMIEEAWNKFHASEGSENLMDAAAECYKVLHGAPPWWEFYRIPLVKLSFRLFLSVAFVVVLSRSVVMVRTHCNALHLLQI